MIKELINTYLIRRISIVSSMILVFILVCGCNATFRGTSGYEVKVSGLINCTGSGHTQIYVPMPMIEGKPLFPDNDSFHIRSGNWSSRVVDTDHGKMYLLWTNDTNLTDINVGTNSLLLYKSLDEEKNAIMGAKSAGNYTSFIYLDEGITSSGNVTINYYSKVHVMGTHKETDAGSLDLDAYSSEDIPANATGWIPIKVRVE